MIINSVSDLLIVSWATSVVSTVTRLNVFSILSSDMMTVEELSSNCRAVPHLLKPLLDACVSMGLMELQNDKYMNSHFSRVYLVEGRPSYVGDFVKLTYTWSKHWDKLYDIVTKSNKCQVR